MHDDDASDGADSADEAAAADAAYDDVDRFAEAIDDVGVRRTAASWSRKLPGTHPLADPGALINTAYVRARDWRGRHRDEPPVAEPKGLLSVTIQRLVKTALINLHPEIPLDDLGTEDHPPAVGALTRRRALGLDDGADQVDEIHARIRTRNVRRALLGNGDVWWATAQTLLGAAPSYADQVRAAALQAAEAISAFGGTLNALLAVRSETPEQLYQEALCRQPAFAERRGTDAHRKRVARVQPWVSFLVWVAVDAVVDTSPGLDADLRHAVGWTHLKFARQRLTYLEREVADPSLHARLRDHIAALELQLPDDLDG